MLIQSLFSAFSPEFVPEYDIEDRASVENIMAAVIAELDFALIACAVTASLVTACAMLRPLGAQYSPLSYLPPEQSLSSSTAFSVTGLDLPMHVRTALQDFHDTVSFAKAMTFGVDTGSAPERQTRASGAVWMAMSSAWRRAASAAITAGDEVHHLTSSDGDRQLAHWPALRTLLSAVRDGASPCVSSDGHVVFPNWAERRHSQRKPINVPAFHCVGTHKSRVILADISQTGFGLLDCHGVTAGNAIAVELASGRVLSGVAVWSRDNRAGVRFRQPLTRNDVLLA